MIVVSILFFIAAAAGIIRIMYGAPPTALHFSAHTKGSGQVGAYWEAYVRLYILPFFWAFVGWLLYKCGSEKIKTVRPEEKESQDISE